ncbi:Fasciclin-like arabinogalactan protein 7 [Linum grandiflorum]
MEFSSTFLVFFLLAVLSSTSTESATVSPPAPISFSPAPAPAPTSPYVNLTDLLSVAGPFHTFLDYLQSTKVIDTFQNQANDTDQGITLFVPKDSAFSGLKPPLPSLSNVSSDQLKQIMLFHALPHYYSFADFKNLTSPVSTFAGSGQSALSFTYVSGLVRIDSGWSKTKVTSSVHSTAPVAIYQVDKVLLPEAVFGTDIPPMPAPAPAPDAGLAPAADSPSADATAKGGKASASSSSSSSVRFGLWSQLLLAVSGVIVLML